MTLKQSFPSKPETRKSCDRAQWYELSTRGVVKLWGKIDESGRGTEALRVRAESRMRRKIDRKWVLIRRNLKLRGNMVL